MSAGGAFGGARGYQARPPEKGIFPLDHFGECKQVGTKLLLAYVLGHLLLLSDDQTWSVAGQRGIPGLLEGAQRSR